GGGGVLGAVLGDGDQAHRGVAVGGAGGGEDEAFDGAAVAGGVQGLEHGDGGGDVVAVVPQGVFDGLADVGDRAEVHDGVEVVGVHRRTDGGPVAQVGVDE